MITTAISAVIPRRPTMVAGHIVVAEGDADLVTVLDAGADDYIAKPFVVEVLPARMRAALRRGHTKEVPAAIVTEDFTIPDHIVSREQILEEIWGPRGVHRPHYLRVFVNRVRQKLEPDPAHPRYVHAATGLGLVFKLEPELEVSEHTSQKHQEVP